MSNRWEYKETETHHKSGLRKQTSDNEVVPARFRYDEEVDDLEDVSPRCFVRAKHGDIVELDYGAKIIFLDAEGMRKIKPDLESADSYEHPLNWLDKKHQLELCALDVLCALDDLLTAVPKEHPNGGDYWEANFINWSRAEQIAYNHSKTLVGSTVIEGETWAERTGYVSPYGSVSPDKTGGE
jgi:hypothetical protein